MSPAEAQPEAAGPALGLAALEPRSHPQTTPAARKRVISATE